MVTRDTLSHKWSRSPTLSALRGCAISHMLDCSAVFESGSAPSSLSLYCVSSLAPTHFPHKFSHCCECGLERDLISGDSDRDTVHTDTPTRTRLRVKVQESRACTSHVRNHQGPCWRSRSVPRAARVGATAVRASSFWPASHERRRLRHAPAAAADRHSRRDEDGQARNADEGDRQVLGRGLGRRQAELVGRGLRLQGRHLR